MEFSPLVVCNLPPLCPLPNLPISRPPHLPDARAAEPAVSGGLGKRRKFPGGSLRRKEDSGGNLRWTLKTAEMGALRPSFGPKNQRGRDVIAFENLITFGPRLLGLGGKKTVRGGKPELRPDPGPTSFPMSRASHVLNPPISRPPGDASASGPNVGHM